MCPISSFKFFLKVSKRNPFKTTSFLHIIKLTMSSKKEKSDEPPTKKSKKDTASTSGSSSSTNYVNQLEQDRIKVAPSILEFEFKKQRVRVLSDVKEVPEDSHGILYWMSREMRVQDNWTFLFAQKLALKNQLPLHVCFCLLPKFLGTKSSPPINEQNINSFLFYDFRRNNSSL